EFWLSKQAAYATFKPRDLGLKRGILAPSIRAACRPQCYRGRRGPIPFDSPRWWESWGERARKSSQYSAHHHGPGTLPSILATGLGRCEPSQPQTARRSWPDLQACFLQRGHVLTESGDIVHRSVPGAAWCRAYTHDGRLPFSGRSDLANFDSEHGQAARLSWLQRAIPRQMAHDQGS